VASRSIKKVVDFIENRIRARIGSVDLIEHHDGRQMGLQCLLEHVAGLRKRTFASVNEKEHASTMRSAARPTAEVAVARRFDNIDFVPWYKHAVFFAKIVMPRSADHFTSTRA